MQKQDEEYMAHALRLAERGVFTTAPNPNVGCVIVKDGEIVGEGFHYRAGEPHAEVHALRQAGARAEGATAYVTLEPCSHTGRTPPCCDALIAAGIRRVVVAMQDPNPHVCGRGLRRLRQAGVEVRCGLMAAEAEALNRGFLKRMRTGLPWVQLKLAASLDGRTALNNGDSKWITSRQARQDVQRFRARCDAILSSSNTVLADDPQLTVRWPSLDAETQRRLPADQVRQPLRVIVDSRSRVTPHHRIITQPGATLLARLNTDTQSWPDAVIQCQLPARDGRIDLTALLMLLGRRQINHVWVEAGAGLAGALLSAGLVDELILYLAPCLLGQSQYGLCELPGLHALAEAPRFVFQDIRQVGPDLRLRLGRES